MDRTLSVTTPDQITSYTAYGFGNDGSKIRFKTTQTDALSKITQLFNDARGLKTNITDALSGITKFNYNVLGELLSSTDPENNTTFHEYDKLGRRTQRIHPDAGTTNYSYDAAGNVTTLQTQNLINQSQVIDYNYDFNHLIEITYPQNPENNVYYEYGNPNIGNESGRITRQQDASGVQQFFYGKQGELIRNIHTFVQPSIATYTFEMQWNYDSWNRIKDITYPDGEVVSYAYNNGGQLNNMIGDKSGSIFNYINHIGYNKYEKRLKINNGNGTFANYTYNPLTLQLSNLTSYNSQNEQMQNINYTYDDVSNITAIANTAPQTSNGMGGEYNYAYTYDLLYRLTQSNGNWYDNTYSLNMQYSASGNILNKNQSANTNINGSFISINYNRNYNYVQVNQPHAVKSSDDGSFECNWDANGNLLFFENNEDLKLSRSHCWDEENRLSAVKDKNYLSHYIYDAPGDRVWKQSGQVGQMLINFFDLVNYADINSTTLYTSPYMTINDHEYTKHYYTEGQRVCSKLGGGMQNNLIGIEEQVEPLNANYEEILGTFTEKMQRDFDCVGMSPEYVNINNDQFREFVNNLPYLSNDENDLFFYHSDHIGSSSFITDNSGITTQHLQYLPFGESFVEQQSGAPYNTPYKFSGKEKDEETSYSYFGARYYMSDISIWNSVDPMADKYPNVSAFAYCNNNPINLIDPDGRDWFEGEGGNVIWQKGDAKNIEIKGEKYKNIGTSYSYTAGNTTYNYGNSNQVASIQESVLNNNQFQSQFDSRFGSADRQKVACKRACDVMMSNAGEASAGRNDATQQVGKETKTGIVPTNNLQRGNQTLQNEVDARGNPVIVGVDRGIFGRGMNDGTTDHWVVVSGVNYDLRSNATSYNYFDPGSRNAASGTSSSNTFTRNSNGLLININNRRTYTITNIRPNRR